MIRGPLEEALTFDDVLLIPAKSEVHPREVDVSTRLTRRIVINVPLVSAAMDTVTEARLAIALAREGGIGMIHRAFGPENQASEVDKVKKSESGMIVDPITVRPTQKIYDALEIMERYHISGVPVTDEEGKLTGILTNRDLRFETKFDLPISAVMVQNNSNEGIRSTPRSVRRNATGAVATAGEDPPHRSPWSERSRRTRRRRP